jgi:ATP-dependent DNA ligase
MEIYEPMLLRAGAIDLLERKNLVGYVFEPKFDGTRVLIYKQQDNIAIFNRRKKDIIARYPEFLDLDAFIKAKSCILDGELVVLNEKGVPDPKLLQEREQAHNPLKIKSLSKKAQATIFVFDIIELENKPLVSELLRNRKLTLKDLIGKGPNIALCPYTLHGKDLWKQVLEQGLDGMMAKEVNSKYESGKRSWAWLKIKNKSITDTVVIGFTKTPDMKRSFNSLILARYDKNMQLFKYAGKIGEFDKKTSGFLSRAIKDLENKEKLKQPLLSEDEQKKIQEKIIWLKPELVARVMFKSQEGKELKEPSLSRLRFDKPAEDCGFE